MTLLGSAVALSVGIAFAPLALVLLGGAGLVRGRKFALLRTYVFALWMLVAECSGVLVAGCLWLGRVIGRSSTERYQRWHYDLQRAWTVAMWNGARLAFGFELRLEVTPDAVAAIERGPVVVAARHAGVADVLLPALSVANRFGVDLRYVLKRELLTDPCLDIVGQRIPNAFVGREGTDSARAIAAIAALGQGMVQGQGVMIYPEGTRFTADKRARIIRSAVARGDAKLAAYAESLRATLPPRPGGTLALLRAAPEAQLLVLEHTGFEQATRLPDLASGALVGLTFRARLRAVHWAPSMGLQELREIWLEVDSWVQDNSPDTGPAVSLAAGEEGGHTDMEAAPDCIEGGRS